MALICLNNMHYLIILYKCFKTYRITLHLRPLSACSVSPLKCGMLNPKSTMIFCKRIILNPKYCETWHLYVLIIKFHGVEDELVQRPCFLKASILQFMSKYLRLD